MMGWKEKHETYINSNKVINENKTIYAYRQTKGTYKENSLASHPYGYKTPPPPLSLPSLHGNPTMKETLHFCSKLKKASHSFNFLSHQLTSKKFRALWWYPNFLPLLAHTLTP